MLNDAESASLYKTSISHVVGRPVSEVVDASFGLAFQVYPEAISKMYGAPIWSVLFFIMLITLGLGKVSFQSRLRRFVEQGCRLNYKS